MRLRYYGHMQQASGYGRAAHDLATALATTRADTQVEARTIGPRGPGWAPPDHLADRITGDPDAVIVHTLPGDCPRVLELEGLRRGVGPKLIAYTTWEALSAPPQLVGALIAGFDQVWVPSWATAAAFRADELGGESVHVLPHCFDESTDRRPPTARAGSGYRFLWVGAWTARKNPTGLLQAFVHAFAAEDAVELIMHSPETSVETFAIALAATGVAHADLPTVRLSNRHLSDAGMRQLYADADCFVTATRGEAWNLPAFDAMLAGRHVIAQRGLGSDDFLQLSSAELINGWQAPAVVDTRVGALSLTRTGAQGLSSRTMWLEPDLWALIQAMRWAYMRRQRTIDLGYDPAERFGYAAVARHAINAILLETP